MLEVLSSAGCFGAIILLGYILKRIGLFQESDFTVLSKVVLKITLPAAIVSNFANKELDASLFILILIGFLFSSFYVLMGFLLNIRNSKEQRAFDILNFPGYNIGCFGLPFVQSFLGPTGVIATCLFDIGNGCVCLGSSYSIASVVKDGGRFSMKRMFLTLSKSIPFIMYLIMPTLCLLHVRIPAFVTTFSGIIGNANAFIAMFMIGVGFKITAERSQLTRILRHVAVRYGVALVFSAFCYFLLPFSSEIRKTLVLLVLSPISASVPAFTSEMKSDVGLSSAINSVCVVCSIVLMFLALVILP